MSYMDRFAGVAMSSIGHNGKPRASTGEKSNAHSPEELMAWAMLELAIDDTAILARYGLITRNGDLRDWPMVHGKDHWGYAKVEPMTIACMRDPLDHAKLRQFWLDETQGQLWCDLCGCKLPAKDIWKSILENHAK